MTRHIYRTLLALAVLTLFAFASMSSSAFNTPRTTNVPPSKTNKFARSQAHKIVSSSPTLIQQVVGTPVTSVFELDANATDFDGFPDDWSTLSSGGGTAFVQTMGTNGKVAIADPFGTTIFTGGGSKDDLDIPNWRASSGSVPDKDEITNAYAAGYLVPSTGETILVFGADRLAQNGDAQIGFWFFQSAVSLNANGTFNGQHTNGDLLILSDFTRGGAISNIKAYQWHYPGGSINGTLDLVASGADCRTATGNDKFCAEVNTASVPSPWSYTPKSGPAGFFPPGGFYEGAINLNASGLGKLCFSSFMAETRSSQQVDAVLKDFVLGSFPEKPTAAPTAGGTLSCSVTSVTLNANGTPPRPDYTYSWTTLDGHFTSSATIANPTVDKPGTYSVVVSSPNGCPSDSASVTVTENKATPTVSIDPAGTLTCSTQQVQLFGHTTQSPPVGETYQWTGPGIVSGGNTLTPFVNQPGTYTLTVTNTGSGCSSSASVVVNQNIAPPNANAGADQTLTCTITSVTLQGSSSTAGATAQWSGPNGFTSTSFTPSVSAPGTYTLTVTGPNGCTASDTVVVNQDTTPPNASAGPSKELSCAVTSVTLEGSSSTAGATFSWSGPGIVSGGNTATPTVNTAGTYTLTVTGLNGCTASSQVVVTQNITPPVLAIAKTAANGESNPQTVTVALTDSNTPVGSYQWQRFDGKNLDGTDRWVNLTDGLGISGATTATLVYSNFAVDATPSLISFLINIAPGQGNEAGNGSYVGQLWVVKLRLVAVGTNNGCPGVSNPIDVKRVLAVDP